MPIPQHDLVVLQQCATKAYYGVDEFEICEQHGVSRSTLERWRATPEWAAACDAAAIAEPEVLAAMARGVIRDSLLSGDAITARWVLERRDKTFATPDRKLQVDAKVTHSQVLSQLDTLQLRELHTLIRSNPEQAALLLAEKQNVVDVDFEAVDEPESELNP